MRNDTVHLWLADTRDMAPLVEVHYQSWLTDSEWQALAQKIPKVRLQVLWAKLFLKSILARYVAKAPKALVFSHNAYGKPALLETNLQFNLSHSEHFLALAVCHTVNVGVDVQVMRQRIEPLEIAERFFHQQEYQWLQTLAPDKQNQGFYRLWSAKEAVLKAAGIGIGASGLKDVVWVAAEASADSVLQMDFELSTALFHAFQWQEFFGLQDCAFSLATVQPVKHVQTFHWSIPVAPGSANHCHLTTAESRIFHGERYSDNFVKI